MKREYNPRGSRRRSYYSIAENDTLSISDLLDTEVQIPIGRTNHTKPLAEIPAL